MSSNDQNFSLQNSSSSIGNSTASWPFSPLNPIIQQIISLLNIFEIFVYLPTIPLVLFCIYLVLKTSILHQNLKWVLGALNLQVHSNFEYYLLIYGNISRFFYSLFLAFTIYGYHLLYSQLHSILV